MLRCLFVAPQSLDAMRAFSTSTQVCRRYAPATARGFRRRRDTARPAHQLGAVNSADAACCDAYIPNAPTLFRRE